MIETVAPGNLAPPSGFKYDPAKSGDYFEQLLNAKAHTVSLEQPVPSFESVPTVDITPTFNPTAAPDDEIFARNRVPRSARPIMGLRSEWTQDTHPVQIWRVIDRSSLENGTGLVASSILQTNSLGDVENFDFTKHLATDHDGRMTDEKATTPFVSFSTDPATLAEHFILRYGLGLRNGRDSVIVHAQVDPDRVITGRQDKDPEVLLLGGVASTEYVAAYSIADFITHLVPDGEIMTVYGDAVHRDRALGYWALRDK